MHKGLRPHGNLLHLRGESTRQLRTTDMKLFRVNGPTKQAIHLLRKWEKDVKLNGWIHKTQI